MAALNTFNRVARWYDRLAQVVFGKSIRNAQRMFLKEIPPHSDILILGGGSGWLLQELLNCNATCRVWYVDASSVMIQLSQQRLSEHAKNRVHFIHGTEDSIPEDKRFQVVITFFFLDLFSVNELPALIPKICSRLSPQGIWLAADFLKEKAWHRLLLQMMYVFFNLLGAVSNSTLPDWELHLKNAGLVERNSAYFFRSFIKAAVLVRHRMNA